MRIIILIFLTWFLKPFLGFNINMYTAITKCFVCIMCVAGGVRGLGASMGKPQWHSLCRHPLVKGGPRKRAVHACPGVQRHHRSSEKETGDEVGSDVVLPARTSWLCQGGYPNSTALLPEPCFCVAPCWSLEILPEVS